MKHRLVSAPTLAGASLRMNLGDFLRFGRGEEKSGGRRKDALLADVLEALAGAIFIDGGLAAATDFVQHALGEELRKVTPVASRGVRLQDDACRRNCRQNAAPRLAMRWWRRLAHRTDARSTLR